MQRRAFLGAVGIAGSVGVAGCGTVRPETTLAEPTVSTESDGRGSISFTANGTEIASLGIDGAVASGAIDVSTEIWHRKGTRVESIALGVWMPSTGSGSAADVAVLSPVAGDSPPPPSISLSSPRPSPGTLIESTDPDDLADETISTLDLVVRPSSTTATTVAFDATIELTNNALLILSDETA
jgi:hypothetical protein